ncbi:MAG: hypothetical protein KAI67_03115 [Candidatus Pacebacteria bacterium]|nr:hypothetical protein [Candidatus Paceibacterota bacterium]
MITKTYLDGKLNQLEGSLKRRIESKENMQSEEINKKISALKESIDLINEKVIENRDILDNYLVEHNGLKQGLEKLEDMPEISNKDNYERSLDKNENNEDNDDGNQIIDDLQ